MDVAEIRKNVAIAKFQPTLGLFQLVRNKGKFWTKCGFSINSTNFLYPEEGLWLHEINQLAVSDDGSAKSESVLTKEAIFNLAIAFISIPVYLTYLKLKVIDKLLQDKEYRIYSFFRND